MRNLKIVRLSAMAIFMICAAMLSAQIPQGTFRLGPDVSYSSSTTDFQGFDLELKTSSVQIGAQAGYYVIDNLEVGLLFSFLNSKTEVQLSEE